MARLWVRWHLYKRERGPICQCLDNFKVKNRLFVIFHIYCWSLLTTIVSVLDIIQKYLQQANYSMVGEGNHLESIFLGTTKSITWAFFLIPVSPPSSISFRIYLEIKMGFTAGRVRNFFALGGPIASAWYKLVTTSLVT